MVVANSTRWSYRQAVTPSAIAKCVYDDIQSGRALSEPAR